jgi:hypothetical protein
MATPEQQGGNTMDTQRFIAGPLSVLCILALVMGTASAAVITATGRTSNPDAGHDHHHLSPEAIINTLEQEGVDVTEVRTFLQNGDTDAVRAWLEAHRPTMPDGSPRSPPDLTDSTRQQEIITRLEEEGVDVSDVKASLQTGDITAVQAWLETYLHSHEGEMAFHRPPAEPPAVGRMGTGE